MDENHAPVVSSGHGRGRLAKMANECLAAGDEEGAISFFRQAIAADACPPAWWYAGLANVFFKQERLDEADRVFEELIARHPENVQGYVGRARVLQTRQAWQLALAAWEEVAARFPDSLHGVVWRTESLIRLGRFDEAEVLLRQAAMRWPDDVSPLTGLARVATESGRYQQACDRWSEAVARFPENLSVRASYIRSLLDVLDPERALSVFVAVEESQRSPAYRSVLADIHAASYDWPAVLGVLRQVVEAAPENVDLGLKEVGVLQDLSRYTGEPAHLQRAVSLCEALVGAFPHSSKARIALAECFVAASRDADAARVIEGLPGWLDTHQQVMELKSWKKYHDGDLEGAKQVWRAIERSHSIPTVHAPLGSLEQIDGRVPRPGAGEVLLFTVLRNEAWRLPRFLQYYRSLGVGRFFVVDNGSDDGGTDFLLAQDDVHVFRTEDSFAKSSSGMRWVNELVERFGDDHWCLYVDADEMLVFPGAEDLGLAHLLHYMERKGHEALFAFMLDMHGPTARYRPDRRPGDDLLQLYPFFENTYHRAGAVRCPYRQMSGGILRSFRSTWDLTKTPIVRGGRSIRFLSSSHAVTPAAVSDVTGVLLHFKMAGDLAQGSLSGIGSRSPMNIRRHLGYSKELQAMDEGRAFVGASTVRYESSRQLVAIGLIECPDDFLADAPQSGGDSCAAPPGLSGKGPGAGQLENPRRSQ
jgi:tetratricopeptide (TPR) repeat protein